jgi:hypothetical protein
VFKEALFYLITVPKCKSGDAGNSGRPNKSHLVLPLSEKVKVPDIKRKEKKL